MREMKDPRMKNLTNLVFIKGVFAILTCSILIYFIFKNIVLSLEFIYHKNIKKRLMLHILFLDSARSTTWKLSKSLDEDSSIDCTTPRRTPKMKRVDYYLEDIQEALVGPPFKIYVRTTS
jgi:hypothetical protein